MWLSHSTVQRYPRWRWTGLFGHRRHHSCVCTASLQLDTLYVLLPGQVMWYHLGCLLLGFFLHGFFFWKVYFEVVPALFLAVNKLYCQEKAMNYLQQEGVDPNWKKEPGHLLPKFAISLEITLFANFQRRWSSKKVSRNNQNKVSAPRPIWLIPVPSSPNQACNNVQRKAKSVPEFKSCE